MKIGFIGMGNMAGAIAKGIINSNFIDASIVYAYDIDNLKSNRFGMTAVDSIEELINSVEVVFISIKPNLIEEVIGGVKQLLADKVVISIAAGYNYERYSKLLLPSTRHVSVMPNTPATVLEGMTLIEETNNLKKEELDFVISLFDHIGSTQVLKTDQMTVGASISGCGPAFMYMMIEAIGDGAVELGFERETAYKLAAQTMLGAAKMVQESDDDPIQLRINVCSPGGITLKGVQALNDNNFNQAVQEAIKKSR